MRRVGRNGNHITFAEVVSLPARNPIGSRLAWGNDFGIGQRSPSHKRSLAIDDDEDMVGCRVHFSVALHGAVGKHDETVIADDLSTFDHGGGDAVVINVVNAHGNAGSHDQCPRNACNACNE